MTPSQVAKQLRAPNECECGKPKGHGGECKPVELNSKDLEFLSARVLEIERRLNHV